MKLQATYLTNDFSRTAEVLLNDEAMASQENLTKFLLDHAGDFLPGLKVKEIHVTLFGELPPPKWWKSVIDLESPAPVKKGKK